MPVSNMARGAGGNLANSELDSYTPAMNDGSDRRLQETVSRPDLDPMSPGPTRDIARWIAIAIGEHAGNTRSFAVEDSTASLAIS